MRGLHHLVAVLLTLLFALSLSLVVHGVVMELGGRTKNPDISTPPKPVKAEGRISPGTDSMYTVDMNLYLVSCRGWEGSLAILYGVSGTGDVQIGSGKLKSCGVLGDSVARATVDTEVDPSLFDRLEVEVWKMGYGSGRVPLVLGTPAG